MSSLLSLASARVEAMQGFFGGDREDFRSFGLGDEIFLDEETDIF